jgi:hypothetical protein
VLCTKAKYFALVHNTSQNKTTIQDSNQQKSSGANTRKYSILNIIYSALGQPRITVKKIATKTLGGLRRKNNKSRDFTI